MGSHADFKLKYLVFFAALKKRFPLWGRPSGAFDVSDTCVRSFWMAGLDPPAAAEMNPTGMECAAMRNCL